MKRRLAREKAMQALFQMNISGLDSEEAVENVLEDEKEDEFLTGLVTGTVEHLDEIDKEIRMHLENWSIDRLGKVDLTILRLGAYELMYEKETPPNAVINEAVEIAKTFGDEKSGKFVNGILSKIKGE